MSGAERAFEQLRAEVAVLRRVVEQLQDTVEAVPTGELSATLSAMAKTQAGLLRRLERISDYLGAATPPVRLQRELAWARDTALRPVIERLTSIEGEAQGVLQTLRALIGSVRSNNAQRRARVQALAIGGTIGIAACIPFVLPTIDAMAELRGGETPTCPPAAALGLDGRRDRGVRSGAGRFQAMFPIGKDQMPVRSIFPDRGKPF